MYKLSKVMSSVLEDYGVAEYGEEVSIDWIVGEAECTTLFSNSNAYSGDMLNDYLYIMNPDNKDKEVLMYGELK